MQTSKRSSVTGQHRTQRKRSRAFQQRRLVHTALQTCEKKDKKNEASITPANPQQFLARDVQEVDFQPMRAQQQGNLLEQDPPTLHTPTPDRVKQKAFANQNESDPKKKKQKNFSNLFA